MPEYLSVKNYERFQHYKDRKPTWVKLYNDLLDDYEFGCLPDASKWLAVGLWLLASRNDNRIPADPRWIGRMVHASEEVDLTPLLSAGFIHAYDPDSKPLADPEPPAIPERERESEVDTETTPSSVIQLRARDAINPDQAANEIFRAANRGMLDNPAIGKAANPIPIGHSSRQHVMDWLKAGIPPDLIAETVYERAKTYRLEGNRRQVTSMAYFGGAVQDDFERWKATQTEVPNGRRDHGVAAAGGRPGGKPDKYGHLLVEGDAA